MSESDPCARESPPKESLREPAPNSDGLPPIRSHARNPQYTRSESAIRWTALIGLWNRVLPPDRAGFVQRQVIVAARGSRRPATSEACASRSGVRCICSQSDRDRQVLSLETHRALSSEPNTHNFLVLQ